MIWVITAVCVVIGVFPLVRVRENTSYPALRLPFTDINLFSADRPPSAEFPSVEEDDTAQRAAQLRIGRALSVPPTLPAPVISIRAARTATDVSVAVTEGQQPPSAPRRVQIQSRRTMSMSDAEAMVMNDESQLRGTIDF